MVFPCALEGIDRELLCIGAGNSKTPPPQKSVYGRKMHTPNLLKRGIIAIMKPFFQRYRVPRRTCRRLIRTTITSP